MCIVATQQHGTDGQRGGIQHGGHGEGHQTHTQGPEFRDYVTTVAIYFGEDEELVRRLLKTDSL